MEDGPENDERHDIAGVEWQLGLSSSELRDECEAEGGTRWQEGGSDEGLQLGAVSEHCMLFDGVKCAIVQASCSDYEVNAAAVARM